MADQDYAQLLAEKQREQALQAQQEQTQSVQASTSPLLQGALVGKVASDAFAGTPAAVGNQALGGINAAGTGFTSAVSQTIPAGAPIPSGYVAAVGPSPAGTQSIVAAPASSPFALSGIGSAGNFILPAVGAYGAYDLIKRQGDSPKGDYVRGIGQGAASGAAIGSGFGGAPGAAIGAGVGAVVGGIGAFTGSGKDKDQMQRDEVRKRMQKGSLIDDNFTITLADGSKFDVGKDGHFTMPGFDGKPIHPAYEADWSNPLMAETVALTNPLVEMITAGMNDKARSDMTSQLSNAFVSNAKNAKDVQKNVIAAYNKAGITTFTQGAAYVDELLKKGSITQDEANVYKGSLQKILPAGATGIAYNSPFGQASYSLKQSAGVPTVDRVQAPAPREAVAPPVATPRSSGMKDFAETLSSAITGGK